MQLVSIQTSPNDRLLWALDNRGSVFVRTGLSDEMPVGTDWELVPGTHLSVIYTCLSGVTNLFHAVCGLIHIVRTLRLVLSLVSSVCTVVYFCIFRISGESAGPQLSDRLGSLCKRRFGSTLRRLRPKPCRRLLEEDPRQHQLVNW